MQNMIPFSLEVTHLIFVSSDNLVPGMCLGRDLNFYDSAMLTAVNLKAGTKLTDANITQMKRTDLDGAYIDDAKSVIRVISSINTEIKNEAISGVKNLANDFMSGGVTGEDVDEIGDTTEKLIDTLSSHSDIMVNIADIKMYDDYTFHHSLSVSIMALAIGMELGLNKKQLTELGLSGLLHDIGKVLIPIEIINKPGRLTPEEFNIVKMHPIHAANHLIERKLVPPDSYYGIVGHHEKMDGTGYPRGLKGDEIHKYARILAVADVFDALTSQRPYRKPSPPSEAIEYIMGGMGSHFDEDCVRAFLRKVAPYPVGTIVQLSNGEKATVMENFRDQPLRPLVSVMDRPGLCYDLYHDERCFSIVITGIADPNVDTNQMIVK